MAWLEDLLLGADAFLPDYGRTGMDLSPEERRRLIEERMRGYQSQVQGYDLNPFPPFEGLTLAPHAQEWLGQEKLLVPGSSGAEGLEQTGAAKAGDALTRVKEARAAAEEAEETERLRANAMQASLDAPLQMPSEKLLNIRAQARAKGRAGSLGADVDPTYSDYLHASGGERWTEPSFSQQADSPELQARLADREAWVAEGPERDLAFLASAEQARRNPELAISAAEQLKGLRAQKTLDRQVANQEALIEKVKSTGGKVPFDIANQLELAGFTVPWPMRGMSKDDAQRELLSIQARARADIERLGYGGAPESVVRYLSYVESVMPELISRLENEDPDAIVELAMELVARNADQSGARQFAQQMAPQQGQ
jgi:hypothetical protein